MSTAYRPLTDEEQIVSSGEVLASGEANYADLGLQRTSGLPELYETKESGILDLDDHTEVSGVADITNSILSPLFDNLEFSFSPTYLVSDLSQFRPYIHYYPALLETNLSNYANTTVSSPFMIDYSLVFERSNAFNNYNNKNNSFAFNVDDVFLLPPRNFY